MKRQIPLSNGFTLVSMLGTIIFGWYTIFGGLNPEWGFTLTFMFIVFLVASMVSVTPEDEKKKKR
jgi:hypothetical protein